MDLLAITRPLLNLAQKLFSKSCRTDNYPGFEKSENSQVMYHFLPKSGIKDQKIGFHFEFWLQRIFPWKGEMDGVGK